MGASTFDCIVIGCGPAGLQAATYLARAQFKTLVLGDPTQGHLYQSHIIANYFGFPKDISGPELIDRGKEQAERFGAVLQNEDAVTIQQEGDLFTIRTVHDHTYSAQTVIIATGMQYKASGIAHEKTFVGKGLSYCVMCDGAFFRDKNVCVVGNGSYAAEEALSLLRYTKKVTIINQRKQWDISPEFAEALAPTSIVKVEHKIKELTVGDSGFVSGVTYDDGTTASFDGVFVAVGTAGPTSFARQLGLLLEGQFIAVDRYCRTNIPGVYAVGNCTGANAQVATSVGMGCDAAIDIIRSKRGQKIYVDYN